MVTYIQDENGWLNLTSDAYLETSKNPRWSCFWEQLKNEAVNWFQKKTPSQKIVQFNYAWVLRQLNNFNGTNCFSPFRVGISCLICRASAILLFNVLFLKPFDRISKWSMFTFSWAVFSACSYKCDLSSRPKRSITRSENLLRISPIYVSSPLRSRHWAL